MQKKNPNKQTKKSNQTQSSKLLFVIHDIKRKKIDKYNIEKVPLENSEGNANGVWFYDVFSAGCFLCQGLEVAVQLFIKLLSLCFDGCKSLRRQRTLIPLMWSFNSAQ